MSWFQLESGFRDHPKLKKLASKLDISHNEAKGMVASLWCWCLDHAVDGDLASFDAWDIADASGWEADPSILIQGLVSVRLLDTTEHGFVVHEWMDRAGSFREALRKRKSREKKREDTVSRDCPVTVPSTCDDVSDKEDREDGQDREDRRRGRTVAPSATRSAPESPPAFEIPTTNGEHAITEADVYEWAEAYPGVDIEQALRSMRQWCLSNPAKKKTTRGVRRFITAWLDREQNKGGNSRGAPRQKQSTFRNVTEDLLRQAQEEDQRDAENGIRGYDVQATGLLPKRDC